MILLLKIIGGLAALGLGIFLGVGTNRQSSDEMGQLLGRGQPRKVKQHFMWLNNYMKPQQRGSQRRAKREPFKTAASTKDASAK